MLSASKQAPGRIRTSWTAAVLNVALPGVPDEDEQQMFFGLIDDLTPTHLQMLDMIRDPRDFVARRRGKKPQMVVTNREHVVRTTMPELAAKGNAVVDRYFFDLERFGLIEARPAPSQDPLRYRPVATRQGDLSYRATPWGTAFLDFIRDPRTDDTPPTSAKM